jgi:3-hydroxyisobutyrate dehydrogenase
VFAATGRKTVWLGDAGKGSQLKLVVNAYMSILIEGVAEALELADRLGIDHRQLAEAIEGGPMDAPIADAELSKMDRGDLELPRDGSAFTVQVKTNVSAKPLGGR